MSQPLIVLGDISTHKGSRVITASSSTDSHGRAVARVGDKVSCPRCGGIFAIVEGDTSFIDDGMPVAYHGCKVECGAMLISSQVFTTTSPSADAACPRAAPADARSALPPGYGMVSDDLAASYEEEALDEERHRFRGRFRVIDRDSGDPAAGHAMQVASNQGQRAAGATDSDGFTPWVERDAAELLSFRLEGSSP
jgi:uncharacterized Zn-binding protein involved in type VI secretion